MKKWLWIIGIIFIAVAAFGQTGNTFYASRFPGNTVGAKVQAAQKSCLSGTSSTCVIVIGPSLASYAIGTMPAKCASCVWEDYRSGSPYLPSTGGRVNGSVSAASVNGAYNPAACGSSPAPAWCTGSDMGAWINAAISHLGEDGTLRIPGGEYDVTTTIKISQAQFKTLSIDCGSRATVLNYTGSGALFSITSNQNSAAQVAIENCSLYGGAAGSLADGIDLIDSQNVRLVNDYIYGFPGYGLFGKGSIGLNSFGTDISSSGLWNVKLEPDTATSFQSNANHFYGGSLVYGGEGNFWDAGESSEIDEGNTLDGVTLEESKAVPQVLLGSVTNDSIAGGYVEYLNLSSTSSPLCSLVIGNAAGTGWGSNVDQTAANVEISNLEMSTPSSSGTNLTANLCFENSTYATVSGINAFGSPEYGAYFNPTGNTLDNTVGPGSLRYATAQYNTEPNGNLLWVPYGTTPGMNEWSYGTAGSLEFGRVDASQGVYTGSGNPYIDSAGLHLTSQSIYCSSGGTCNLGTSGSQFGSGYFGGVIDAANYEYRGSPLASTDLSDTASLARLSQPAKFSSLSGSQSVAFSLQSAAGSGATATCYSGVSCSQLSGVVKLTTGTTPVSGNIITISWPTALSSSANCFLENALDAPVLPSQEVNLAQSSASSFTVYAGGAPSASTVYYVAYHCDN